MEDKALVRGEYAPIALFVYNRLDHFKETIAALLKNKEAQYSDLFIYSDHWKADSQRGSVQDVRSYAKEVSGFKRVEVVERTENFGLANSIVSGVTDLCDRYGRAIVLEDDIVTSAHFLKYMNDCLNVYELQFDVAHVSGYRHPINVPTSLQSDIFFLRLPMCWGWGTWKRAWSNFTKEIDPIVASSLRSYINFGGAHDYFVQFDQNKSGKINTWFIFWYLTTASKKMVSIFPRESMVRNIGMDYTGVHSQRTNDYDVNLCDRELRVELLSPYEENYIENSHVEFYEAISRKEKTKNIIRAERVYYAFVRLARSVMKKARKYAFGGRDNG